MSPTYSHVANLALAAPLASPDARREIDLSRVRRAARELLLGLGADVDLRAARPDPRRRPRPPHPDIAPERLVPTQEGTTS